jgi:hypothetical protein
MSVGITPVPPLRTLPYGMKLCRASTAPLALVVILLLPKWSVCKKYSVFVTPPVFVISRIATNCAPAK